MPVTIMTQVQEALATTSVLDTPAMVEQELSVPKTGLPATTANNESQLGALYCCITFFYQLINIAVIALLNAIAEAMSDIRESL